MQALVKQTGNRTFVFKFKVALHHCNQHISPIHAIACQQPTSNRSLATGWGMHISCPPTGGWEMVNDRSLGLREWGPSIFKIPTITLSGILESSRGRDNYTDWACQTYLVIQYWPLAWPQQWQQYFWSRYQTFTALIYQCLKTVQTHSPMHTRWRKHSSFFPQDLQQGMCPIPQLHQFFIHLIPDKS